MPWKTAPAPAGSAEEPSAKSTKRISPSTATSPAETVLTAPAPVPRRMRLSLVAHDGRPLKSCRVIALGRDRVIGDYEPDENGAGPAALDLRVSGSIQRIVVIPEERDLAVQVQDVNLDRGEAVNMVLSRGMQVGGTVVDSKGSPVVNASVSCEIPLPPDPRPSGENFANTQDDHEAFTIVGNSLLIFADSDAQGRFYLARLPESAANVTIALGKRSISQAGSGLSMRVILPDADPK